MRDGKMIRQWTRFSEWWTDSIRQRLGPPVAGKLTIGEIVLFVLVGGNLATIPFALSQSEPTDGVLSGILLGVYSLAAILLLLVAGRNTNKQAAYQLNSQNSIRRVGRSWQIIGLGVLVNILGGFIWIGLTWLGKASFPSLADLFYLGSYPIIVAGILHFPYRKYNRLETVIRYLEVTTVTLCVGLYIWNYLAKPLSDARMVINRLEMLITVSYPLFDLLMLVGLMVLVYRSMEWVHATPLVFLELGVLMWLVGDTVLGLQVIAGNYQAGGFADSSHLLSYVFWGGAGLCQIFSVREGVFSRRQITKPRTMPLRNAKTFIRSLIPSAVMVMTILILWKSANRKLPMRLDQLMVWVCLLLILASLLQILQILQNRRTLRGMQRTNSELERRVAERTHTLSNMTEALRMSEAHYRAVVEDTPVLVCTFREDGKLTFVNQAYAAYFNCSAEGLVGRSFYSLIPPDERQVVEQSIQTLSKENPIISLEYPVHTPDGEIRWQRWVNRMVIEGMSVKCQAIGEDITERRLTEERLRESEERYRLLFETMAQGVLLQDDQGKVISGNPAAEHILGLTIEQMQGKLTYEPNGEPIREDGSKFTSEEHPVIEALRSGKEVNNVVMGIVNMQDGQRRWINVHAFPKTMPGEDHPTRVYVTFEDITERKKSEQAQHDANLQLSRGVEELSLLARLDELLQLCQNAQEAYQAIDTIVEHIFKSERGTIFMVEPDGSYQERVVWGHTGAGLPIDRSQCMALRYGRLYYLDDTRNGLVCDHIHPKVPVSTLCVPMIAQNEIYGSLHIEADLENGRLGGLDESRRRLAMMVGNSIALALSNIRLRERLHEQAVRDPLTGLFNRRFMEESLKRELLRVERSEQSLAVLMMDIDHFKIYNDKYGHEAGDLLLTEVAKLIRSRIRGSDIACRYGGEEIVLVLPAVVEETVWQRTEMLRLEISQLRLVYAGEILEPVTVSVGIAMCPKDGKTPQDLLKRADQALYAAKEAGRNRISQ